MNIFSSWKMDIDDEERLLIASGKLNHRTKGLLYWTRLDLDEWENLWCNLVRRLALREIDSVNVEERHFN